MNPKRLALAILAVFAGTIVLDALIHIVLLGGHYDNSPSSLWRPEPEMLDRALWINFGQLLASAALVFVRAAFLPAGSLRRVCGFGLGLGFFKYADLLGNYAVLPIPGAMASKWFFACVIEAVVLTLIAYKVYQPAPPDLEPARLRTLQRRWGIVTAAIALVLGVWVGYDSSSSAGQRVEPTARWMQALEPAWAVDSPGKPWSIRSVSDVRRDGQDSVRFELRGREMFRDRLGRDSSRAELDVKDFPPMGSVRWYTFSLYLPPDFPKDDSWLVLAQWHGADKRQLGEISRRPVLALVENHGRFSFQLRHTSERVVKDDNDTGREMLFETNSLPPGQWNDFVVQARWSWESNGLVNIWMNGKQIVRYRGPACYNDNVGPYFRFGIYRNPTERTHVAWFNNVQTGTSPEELGLDPEVLFAPAAAPAGAGR